MRDKESGCVVCGRSPTVRAHLFPKALVHRIKSGEKHIIEGDRVRKGINFSQSGNWDDGIVCDIHEGAFSSADDYIARFSRNFQKLAVLAPDRKSYEVSNPRPDLLLRFAVATVWRHVVSARGMRHGLDLGPYRRVIEQHLFEDQPCELEALVGRSNIVDLKGSAIELGLAPYKRKLLDWTVWHFTIGGFEFYLKADQRPFPGDCKEFLANDNDPITLTLIDPQPIHKVPMFQAIFANMRRRRVHAARADP